MELIYRTLALIIFAQIITLSRVRRNTQTILIGKIIDTLFEIGLMLYAITLFIESL